MFSRFVPEHVVDEVLSGEPMTTSGSAASRATGP